MNAAHFHLMFNHLSIVGLGFAIIFNLYAIIRKNEELIKLSCWFYILIALLSVIAVFTGDGAGEIVKTYPGISNDAIEYHETWGYVFFYGLIALGVSSLKALWFSRKNIILLKNINIATLVLAVIILVFAYQVGTSGGKIRHPEIEQGTFRKS